MKNPHPIAISALAFLSLAGATPAHAGAEDCLASELKRPRTAWVHPELPDRKQLDPLFPKVRAAGGFVLLDEVMYSLNDRVYSFMAMLGNDDAVRELGTVRFDTGFAQFAEILARVQNPDGSVTDLGAGDIRCAVVRYANQRREILGKSYSQKIYSFTFPRLQPGSVIQYQIGLRHHAGEARTIITDVQGMPGLSGFGTAGSSESYSRITAQSSTEDPTGRKRITTVLGNDPFYITLPLLGDQYGAVFPTRLGAQRRILGDAGTRYPAATINYLFVIPKTGKFSARQLTPGMKYNVADLPTKDPYSEKTVLIQTNRPALAREPWEPDYALASPYLATIANGFGDSPSTRPWRGYADWGDWITRNEVDYVTRLRGDGAARQALVAAEPSLELPGNAGKLTDLATRYLRDRVANAEGREGREGRVTVALRPPLSLINGTRVGWPIEKALALIAVLRAGNIPARLAYVRAPSATPIDKAVPSSGWFEYENFLVAVDAPGAGRRFLDPSSPVAVGAIPARLQGGEALLVSDAKTHQWAALPVSAEDDNVTREVVRITGAEGGALKGEFRVEMTGREAESYRSWRELPDADVERAALKDLRAGSREGVTLGALRIENLSDPDQPLVFAGTFVAAGAAPAADGHLRASPLVLRPGPVAATFAAENRVQDIDFHIPQRYELEVHLPASLGKFAPLAPVVLNGPGLEYRYQVAAEEGGTRVTRVLRLHGVIPAARYPELRTFIRQAEQQDLASLIAE